MIVKVIIQETELDLYEEEDISLTASVVDIQDITKNTTDYSRQFTVPATAINNKFFKHYYYADIDNSFDARIKVDGRIELAGLPFRVGKFLLLKVNVKKGKPDSYMVHFWGNLISIKDTLGKDELTDLDLSAFDHNFTSANVLTGLTTSLFSGSIIYNLFVKKQYYYNSAIGDTTQTDLLSNIAYNTASGDNGITWNDLRPSIKLIDIIEAIETDYSLTFSRHFFDRAEFDLYLWLNSDDNATVGGGELDIDLDSGSSTYFNLSTNKGTFLAENANPRRWYQLYLTITPSAGYENVEYTTYFYRDSDEDGDSNQLHAENTATGTHEWYQSLRTISGADTTFTVYYTIRSSQEFKFTTQVRQVKRSRWGEVSTVNTFGSEQTITSLFEIVNNLPKIETINFLKGIFQMFKLVVIPQQDGTIYVNTLNDYYREGAVFDITKYLITKEHQVERGDILSEIFYKFQDPKTVLNIEFLRTTGTAYGDEELILRDDAGEVLDGDKLEIQVPFEMFIYERLKDQVDNTLTQIQYGAIIDENANPANPAPHIFYNINKDIGSFTVAFIDDSGSKNQLTTTINTPSHVDNFDFPNFGLLFSEEFNEWDGALITQTLYALYHQIYINNIFNIKRRDYRFMAQLPLRILAKLELNDTLKIGFDYYLQDKFTLGIVSGKIELNLINSFTYGIAPFSARITTIDLTFDAQAYYSYVTNLVAYTVTKTDTGDGIGWITVTDDGNNIIFTATENTALGRNMSIEIENDATLETIDYEIFQSEGIITADTNLVTADQGEYTL